MGAGYFGVRRSEAPAGGCALAAGNDDLRQYALRRRAPHFTGDGVRQRGRCRAHSVADEDRAEEERHRLRCRTGVSQSLPLGPSRVSGREPLVPVQYRERHFWLFRTNGDVAEFQFPQNPADFISLLQSVSTRMAKLFLADVKAPDRVLAVIPCFTAHSIKATFVSELAPRCRHERMIQGHWMSPLMLAKCMRDRCSISVKGVQDLGERVRAFRVFRRGELGAVNPRAESGCDEEVSFSKHRTFPMWSTATLSTVTTAATPSERELTDVSVHFGTKGSGRSCATGC